MQSTRASVHLDIYLSLGRAAGAAMSHQDAARRRFDLLLEHAAEFAGVAVKNIRAEFPSFIKSVMRQPGDFPQRRAMSSRPFTAPSTGTPASRCTGCSSGCCAPCPARCPRRRSARHSTRTSPGRTRRGGGHLPRWPAAGSPLRLGWALTLSHELDVWDDAGARRWSARLKPLTGAIVEALLAWLPKSTYPSRRGEHSNTAFGLRRSLDFARRSAVAGEPALLEALAEVAERWYAGDADYPGAWEPDAADFLSPGWR